MSLMPLMGLAKGKSLMRWSQGFLNAPMKQKIPTILIIINALVFLAMGPIFIFWPKEFASNLGIELTNVTALADFRAMYGGLSVGVAPLFIGSIYKKDWKVPALVVIAGTSGMLLICRLFTALKDGNPGQLIWFFAVNELVSLSLALWALKTNRA